MTSVIRFRAFALGLSIVAALAMGIYWYRLLASTDQLRSSAIEQHSVTATRLAAAAGTQTESLVLSLDAILTHLRADYVTHPRQFAESLQAVMETLPKSAVPQVGVIDSDGYLAASNLGVPEKIYLGDREHFLAHAQGGYGDRLFVSAPVLGRRSGAWSIQLSRRIEKDGKFRGVIVASISTVYLAGQLAKFELGDNDSLSLLRQDGIYLSRSPNPQEFMGRSVRTERPFISSDSGDRGVFRTIASHEPVVRIFAWRRLGNLPLIVVAGLAEADFMAPVEAEIHRNLVRNGIGTALAGLLAGIAAFLLLRIGRQQSQLEAREAFFRTLFEILPEGILLVAPDGTITTANDAATAILDADQAKLNDRPYQLLYPDGRPVPPEDYPSRRCVREGLSLNQALFAVDQNGSRRWISVSSRPMPIHPDGADNGAAISIIDVTRLMELEESLRVSQSVFVATTEGILVTDANTVIISVNPAFSMITGYPAAEAIGRTPRLLKSGLHDSAFYRDMYGSLADHGYWEGEITNRRRDGSLYVEWLKINAVKDDEGRITRYVALLSDITAKKRQQEELWHQANYDALTDLPNRILFQDRLQQATAHSLRHQGKVAVLFIDLDRFKAVNDRHGHLAGDDLLRQAAVRIANCIRDEDTVARVGGDEFLVLLANIPGPEVACGVAEKILGTLNETFTLSIANVNIGASIGIAVFPDQATTADELLAFADAAMYEAKAAGRGAIRSQSDQPDEPGSHGRICGQTRLP